MMSLWDALRMNMMISYQELVRTFPKLLLPIVLCRVIPSWTQNESCQIRRNNRTKWERAYIEPV
ncbi:hypothetical protein AGG97_01490 [Klebsiella michiganensis]|nr:hypothetical protein AGG97_01490 [Klebsiella michiganensis]